MGRDDRVPVDIVHDVLVHLLLALWGRLVLRVGARVDDAVHVDVQVVKLEVKNTRHDDDDTGPCEIRLPHGGGEQNAQEGCFNGYG